MFIYIKQPGSRYSVMTHYFIYLFLSSKLFKIKIKQKID